MALGPRRSTLQLQANPFTLGCLLGIQFPTVGTELHRAICPLSYTPPLGVMGFCAQDIFEGRRSCILSIFPF